MQLRGASPPSPKLEDPLSSPPKLEPEGRMASLRGSLHITTVGVRQMNSTGLAHRKEQQFRSLRWHLHGPGSI